ncbi:MAG: endonuclease III [Candidatus Omnitrophica bacterium CG11_big_fil_rev_8_21_14_0_20_63_9]|nr:MAG: endonuclease III [Candidatus Omnitrophica bacterium CG11_big_fil_rev_8_21_14_0_20_63_9]
MITPHNIDGVLRTVARLIRPWQVPVVTRYRRDPFTTLISCLLSLRTKDATTAAASKRLFRLARTPQQLVRLPLRTIERAIYPVSFYRVKARTLRAVCRALLERHGGRVPDDLDVLLTLNGVGRKTANLVITLAFHKDGICVDTHVHRISNRWGLVRTKTPEQTEMALRRCLPRTHWQGYNDLLVTMGQNLCHPTSPWCSRCPLDSLCPKVGVTRRR